MGTLLEQSGWTLPPEEVLLRIVSRLFTAALLGGMVGLEREQRGRAAGLRTHIMVSLGAAVFVMMPLEIGANAADLAQLVKGVAAGIGFLGAGAILKLTAERTIKGLTTAASIWVTAAVGMAAGAGQPWLAGMAVLLSLIVLFLLGRMEPDYRNGKS